MIPINRIGLLLQWIVIPAAVFAGAEVTFQSYFRDSNLNWYSDRVATTADSTPRLLFLGTSRTRSALDEATFQTLLERDHCAGVAIDLGMGNATSAIHLMALQDRVRADPETLRNVTVFFETPLGLPSFYSLEEFSWRTAERESMAWRWHLILDTVSVRDPFYLLAARLDLEGKIKLLARAWTHDSLLLQKREIIGMRWRSILKEKLEKALGLATKADEDAPSIDLQAGGGIRTDEAGVAEMGAFAQQMIRDLESFDGELPPWEQTPAGSLLDFAQKHGAKVFCFDVPTTKGRRQAYEAPGFQQARQRFQAFLSQRGIPLLRPEFNYDQGDLPDGTHLADSKAPAYTSALYTAWSATTERRD